MAINESIYGTKSSWVQNGSTSIYFPDFENLGAGLTQDRLELGEPIENSISCWRVNEECIFFRLCAISYQRLNNEESVLFDFSTPPDGGFPVFLNKGYIGSVSASTVRFLPAELWGPLSDISQLNTNYQAVKPVVTFDYSKLLIKCRILASNNGDPYQSSNVIRATLEEYYSNSAASYPNIQALYYDMYYDGIQLGREWYICPTSLKTTVTPGTTGYYSQENIDYYKGFNPQIYYNKYNNELSRGIASGTTAETFMSNYPTDIQQAIAWPADIQHKSTGYHYSRFYTGVYTTALEFPQSEAMRHFAMLGIRFVISDVVDATIYYPTFAGKYNTTTGDYLTATEAEAEGAINYDWSDIRDSDTYKGEPPVDPTNYDPDNTTIFPSFGLGTGTENVYALSGIDLDLSLKYIYGDAFNTSDVMYSVKNFLTTNPIDTIHSLIAYPFPVIPYPIPIPGIEYLFSATEYEAANIVFGNVETNISSNRLLRRTGILDMGYIDVFEKYESFLDYSPYTSIMLYIPFCGLISLDCDKYMGHRIYIKYVIDVTTGACTACVLRDGLVTETVNGQIGIQIPLTGIQASQIQAAIDGAQMTYKQQTQATALSLAAMSIGAAATVATGGAALPLLGAIGSSAISAFSGASRAVENRDYQLSHIMTPFKTIGGTGSAIGANMELTPRLYISRPKMLDGYDSETFAETRGNACLISSTLSTFRGYTQVSAADLSGIPASAAEKNKLMQLLQAGIIL